MVLFFLDIETPNKLCGFRLYEVGRFLRIFLKKIFLNDSFLIDF